jgi:hypothetical protein
MHATRTLGSRSAAASAPWFGHWALACTLLLCSLGNAWAQLAGSISRLDGNATITSPSGDKAAAVGAEVNEGDRITTQNAAELVVKLTDGGVLAVRPNSQIVIDRFRYDSKGSADDQSFLVKLLVGGLRSVTGAIGKINPKGVRFTTPTATIGIRGTDFEMTVLEADVPEASAGTYSRVFEGRTYLQNSQGQQVDLAANESAYAPVDMVRLASQFGLLRGPSASLLQKVFPAGKFDNVLNNIQQEAQNRVQNQINRVVPSDIRNAIPALGNIFRR